MITKIEWPNFEATDIHGNKVVLAPGQAQNVFYAVEKYWHKEDILQVYLENGNGSLKDFTIDITEEDLDKIEKIYDDMLDDYGGWYECAVSAIEAYCSGCKKEA